MSKVIHLSDQAHNNAKMFCKQHSLKMSDWVADLIHDAIMYNRVEPRNMPRPIPVQPSVVQPQQIPQSHPLQMPQSQQLQQEVPPVQMNKKKLEKIADELDGENSYPPEAPPWSSPPFWVKTQNK